MLATDAGMENFISIPAINKLFAVEVRFLHRRVRLLFGVPSGIMGKDMKQAGAGKRAWHERSYKVCVYGGGHCSDGAAQFLGMVQLRDGLQDHFY